MRDVRPMRGACPRTKPSYGTQLECLRPVLVLKGIYYMKIRKGDSDCYGQETITQITVLAIS